MLSPFPFSFFSYAMITHVLFDLDGTLADTAPDLARAINTMLREMDRPPLPVERLKPLMGLGGPVMVSFALGIDAGDPAFSPALDRFLDHYQSGLAEETRLFPGMDAVLDTLDEGGYPWGVVTNKSMRFTEPLLSELGIASRAACVVGRETAAHPKPHPAPLLYACDVMRCAPGQAVYVGDAPGDVTAGRAAGTRTVVASYGYIPHGEEPAAWGADAIIAAPLQFLDWLRDHG
jgi:phosphoglycolate phosphatase